MIQARIGSNQSRSSAERPPWLGLALDVAPLVFFAVDAKGRLTHVEAGGPVREGPRPRHAIGASIFDLYRHEPSVVAHARRALEGEELHVVDALRAGQVFETWWRPLRGRRGEPRGAIAIALDVTFEQRAVARLSLVLDNLPCIVWTTDADLRFTSIAGRAAKVGLDLVGRRLRDLPELPPRAIAAHRGALAGLTIDYQLPWRGRELDAHVAPLTDPAGRVTGCVGVALDITEQAASLSLLRATIDSTADGILVVDRAGRIVVYNQRFVELWGLPCEALSAGEDAAALAHVFNQLRDPCAFLARVRELYEDPEAESGVEVLELADGRLFERISRPQRVSDKVIGRVWSFRDVTARRRAEAERDRLLAAERAARTSAQEAERWVRGLLDGVDAILWECRLGCPDFTFVSGAGQLILGYPQERWLSPGFWAQVVHPDDRERVLAPCDPETWVGGTRAMEYRVLDAAGRTRWVRDHVSLVRATAGVVTHLRGVMIDITARKEVEEALAASEARLRAMFDHTPHVAIQSFDLSGRVSWMNPATEQLYGLSTADLVGRTLDEVGMLTAAEGNDLRQILAEVARSGRPHGPSEWTVRRRDGTHRCVLSTIFAAPGSQPEGQVFCMDLDVTARRTAEAALEAHAARLEVLARVSHALDAAGLDLPALATVLAEGTVATVGDASVVVVVSEDGAEVEAVVAQPDAERAWNLAARARARHEPWAGVAATLTPALLEGAALAALDGIPGLRELVVVPLSAHGRSQGTLTVARGGDRGASFSKDDLRLLAELGERAGLAVENARLYRAAEEAVRLRDEFLSVASHELRTPLQSLALVVQSLEASARRAGGLAQVPQATVERGLATLVRQQRRLGRLVDSLLDVTRLGAGQLHLDLEPVDLTQLVDDVVELFRSELAAARCQLVVRASGPAVGTWDRGRLEQVVANLLSNALKYGEGRPVEVETDTRDQLATLRVRDHGIGMDEATRRQLFQRFKRGVSARHYGGLGLGLFIARQLVEAMGGSISVEAAPGEGATFTVELPLREPSAPATRCGE